jgi:hypothetical protein
MSKHLPVRPSLEHLKAQAKDLLDALQHNDKAALARVRQALPSARGATDEKLAALGLALHDAQSVIAREYGLSSWAELKSKVEALTAQAAGLSPEALRDLIERHGSIEIGPELERALHAATARPVPTLSWPMALPLVALRNALLPVGAIAPIVVARASSLAAVRAAQAGSGLLAMFSQKDETDEAPSADDLHPVGSVAELCAVLPTPASASEPSPANADPTLTLVLKSVAWVSLGAVVHQQPHVSVRVDAFVISGPLAVADAPLERELRAKVRQLIAPMPAAAQLLAITDGMNALELADATLANLKCSVEAKATYAREPSIAGRLRQVLALIADEARFGSPAP